MSDRQPQRPVDRARQYAAAPQTPAIRGTVARPWLAHYQTPSSVGDSYGDPITKVSDLVGHVLMLSQVESGKSSSKGRFTRWHYQEIDVETGELVGEPDLLLAFAQPVVRMADNLSGGQLDGVLAINPPLVVRVHREGDVVLFIDP